MPWYDDPDHRFSGIAEKLDRADENIGDLKSEITTFFEKCRYPVFPKLQDKAFHDACRYFKDELTIPIRFSVLSGEIIHHLRSCLDHIVWELSEDAYRESDSYRFIVFPILAKRPLLKHKFTRYKRKIQGIKGVPLWPVLRLISKLQPYRRPYPFNDLLFIVHDMDIIDKHRELVLVNTHPEMTNIPLALIRQVLRYKNAPGGAKALPPELLGELNEHVRTVVHVSFRKFGQRELQPVIPSLMQLTNHVRDVVGAFSRLI